MSGRSHNVRQILATVAITPGALIGGMPGTVNACAVASGLFRPLFGRQPTGHGAARTRCHGGLRRPLVATLFLGAGGLVAAGAMQASLGPSPAITVSALQHRIAPYPEAWRGRAVAVRATVVGFLRPLPDHQRRMQLALIDPGLPNGPWSELWLLQGPENPLLHVLRALPLLGALVPPAQHVEWQALRTYRVQLWPLPGHPCDLCTQAVLLDAA